jgi:hypothetical protein
MNLRSLPYWLRLWTPRFDRTADTSNRELAGRIAALRGLASNGLRCSVLDFIHTDLGCQIG